MMKKLNRFAALLLVFLLLREKSDKHVKYETKRIVQKGRRWQA